LCRERTCNGLAFPCDRLHVPLPFLFSHGSSQETGAEVSQDEGGRFTSSEGPGGRETSAPVSCRPLGYSTKLPRFPDRIFTRAMVTNLRISARLSG